MKLRVWCLGLPACLGVAGAWAAPQRSAPQQKMTVVVVDAHLQPAQPIQSIRVSLTYLNNAILITAAQGVTNRSGQVFLQLSPNAAQSGDLRIEITGAGDLVVYQPADGQLAGLPATVTISLLPKGSPALLGPVQIEAMLRRLSFQNNAKSQEIHALKGALAAAPSQKPDDLTAAMTEWAKANGFAIADVDKQVRQWAEEIQRRKEQATAEQKALAELALKHYGIAARLFDEAANDIGQSMDEDEKRFLEDRRKQLREFVDKKFQSSNTYQLNLQYHQATQILEQARARAAAEHGRYPEDSALRSIWLEAVFRVANGRREEGTAGEASESSPLLAQAIKDYQGLLREYATPAEREELAKTQINLGLALVGQGERSSGAQATELLAQAVQAYRAALEVYTKADLPQDWAKTQINLGVALMDQGDSSAAADAIEAGLEVSPADNQSLSVAEGLYHDKLYRYDRALELAERILKIDPSPESRLNFMEANLTASRFEDCVQQAVLIDNASSSQPAILIRDTLKLTCDWGAGQKSAARQTEKALVSKAAGLQKTGWDFAGTLHFLAASPAFEAGRASWIALFESLESGDGSAMAGALHQLAEAMSR
jgi:tetratricopeptide (TPR) repeat protein